VAIKRIPVGFVGNGKGEAIGKRSGVNEVWMIYPIFLHASRHSDSLVIWHSIPN
jgi:hypothetical protein